MKVEIFSDIACPWCYIGKTRFENALSRYEHAGSVELVWRSFQVDPTQPTENPGTTVAHLAHKSGVSEGRALAMMDNATKAAAEDGLEFHLDRALSSNTFDAHRLAHLAVAKGKGREVMERLMHAYQSDGANVADHETLVALSVEAGMEESDVRETLASGAYADAVETDFARARAYGVNGVPFFVFDETHGVSGAQPAEFFLAALRQLGPQPAPLQTLDGADETVQCGPDGCEVPAG